jgi:hypothetical protein
MLGIDDRIIIEIAIGGTFALLLVGMIPWRRRHASSSAFPSYEKEFTAYESGKHRRYELLFAVNGGAFALAMIQLEPNKQEAAMVFLGRLTLDDLALGMIAFTLIMAFDIAAFGNRDAQFSPETGMDRLDRRLQYHRTPRPRCPFDAHLRRLVPQSTCPPARWLHSCCVHARR